MPETKTQALTKLTDTQLLNLCLKNAQKAQKNSLKVPDWLWPFVTHVSRQLDEKHGLTLEHEPNYFLKVALS